MKFPVSSLLHVTSSTASEIDRLLAASTSSENVTGAISHLPVSLAITAAIAASAGIPLLLLATSKYFMASNYLYKLVWVSAFLVNMITVSIPGRFDGEVKTDTNSPFFWKTLIAPAGYAFAIWGVIYLGEIILSAFVGVIGKPVAVFKRATPFWIACNLFQSIWCLTFRQKFFYHLWVPASQLALAALSQSFAHLEITDAILIESSLTKRALLHLLRFPITLHTGWLTAASLLNFNCWAAASKVAMGSQIALTAGSAYFATAAGLWLTYQRNDPFVALTIAWALWAIAHQTKTKCEVDVPDVVKEALSTTESILAKLLIAAAVFQPVISQITKWARNNNMIISNT